MIKSTVHVKATAKLNEEVERELNKPDPELKKTQAIIDKNTKDEKDEHK